VERKMTGNERERRSKNRYPIQLSVKYHTLAKTRRLSGAGHTVNLSSSGIFVETDVRIPVGSKLEVNIEWPTLLDGTIPLQISAVGKVVRSAESGFAFAFSQYQFRTMSRKLQVIPKKNWQPAPLLLRSAGA